MSFKVGQRVMVAMQEPHELNGAIGRVKEIAFWEGQNFYFVAFEDTKGNKTTKGFFEKFLRPAPTFPQAGKPRRTQCAQNPYTIDLKS